MNEPHQGWVGCCEVPATVWARTMQMRADMAHRLNAHPDEIVVEQRPDTHGVALVGTWLPPR